MESRLTSSELHEKQQLLQDYSPAQEAIALLSQNNGRLDTTFDQLWEEKNGVPTFSQGKSLWQSTLRIVDLIKPEKIRKEVRVREIYSFAVM